MQINAFRNKISIVMAEDDNEDVEMAVEAFRVIGLDGCVTFVTDGQQLIDYLTSTGLYDGKLIPSIDLILLDLNMPVKDGRQALSEIKANQDLKGIPIVVLTASNVHQDMLKSYNLGITSFINKPKFGSELLDVISEIGKYWSIIAKLPKTA